MMKRVSILGLGYIGLPTAILAAEAGYDVFGYDINKEKVARINAGDPTILEPGIEKRLQIALQKKRFKVSTHLEYADCFLITVPTPFKENKTADLQYVIKAGKYIAQRLMPGNFIIVESTVPVGTTERLAKQIEEESGLVCRVDFFIAHCPERGIPGRIFKELVDNDRVIGGVCQKSCELAYSFYSKFVKGFLNITDDKTAEMVKLVENSSRDVQIAFANQVASMCYTAGIDAYHVIELANKHPRVNILTPTCGVGGHCIAIDPWFLIQSFPHETKLLKEARKINDAKPHHVMGKLLSTVQELKDLGKEKPKVLALGLSFKPDVDDLRESPALKIVCELVHKYDSFSLTAYDPYVDKETIAQYGVELQPDLKKALASHEIILILVKHKEFLSITENDFCNKIVLDSCGLLNDLQKEKSKNLLSGAIKTNCIFDNITF